MESLMCIMHASEYLPMICRIKFHNVSPQNISFILKMEICNFGGSLVLHITSSMISLRVHWTRLE